MHFIKVGGRYLNLDLVRCFSEDQHPNGNCGLVAHFSDPEEFPHKFWGKHAAKLEAYLATIACDLDEAEAIAAAAEAPTHQALVDAGLLPRSFLTPEQLQETLATLDTHPGMSAEHAFARVLPSREVPPEEFSRMLATQLADGSALPFSDDGEDAL